MKFVRSAALSALALVAVLQSSGDADAGSRYRILWPHVYAPHIYGNVYRDDAYDEEDDSYAVYDDEEDIIVPRRRHHRDMVMDYYDEEDLEPVYEPPVRKAAPVKPKKTVASKKPVTTSQSASIIVKPKVKPVEKKPVTVASLTTTESVTVPKPRIEAALKTDTPIATQAAPKKVIQPPSKENPVKVASAASPPPKATTGGTIACSKGAEIVSGYGFTSVKPRLCTGATYSFDATRAANAYLIKVSASTGEITDVQKLK